jgi:hypothetical protein
LAPVAGLTLPVKTSDFDILGNHLVSYHQPTWNKTMIGKALSAYTGGVLDGAHPA